MSKLVTIVGGSGFVGRYIARRMAKEGWRVRVAVRNPNEALFVKPYGVVGQVEPVFCNIRDDLSIATVLNGADAVVNCVGILEETGKNTFEEVQSKGAERVARLASEAGVSHFVQISAIGADANSDSDYAASKAKGEAAVKAAFPSAIILRPSIIFGSEDAFFNRFAGMSRFGPILPIVGADTKFQPVWVDDVAQAVVRSLTSNISLGIYELGGPNVYSFRDMMEIMLDVVNRRRLVLNIPFGIANIIASFAAAAQFLSIGIIKAPFTKDQVINLRKDNIVSTDAAGFDKFNITPTNLETILPDYLWRFRPSGQFDEIKDSAKNLKKN